MARVVAQRVRKASVAVDEKVVGAIDAGLAVLVGIRAGDTERDVERLADKLAVLRIFRDAEGKMNLSAQDAGGAMLVVSQFTLYADMRKGRRPSFIGAADPASGERLYEHFAARLESHGYRVKRGRFGAEMLVALENDGPVTIILDSEDL
jgi:D-tyrosyl-tRNA(Tyr) deacylase